MFSHDDSDPKGNGEHVPDLEEHQEVQSHTSIQTKGKTDPAKVTQLPGEKEKIAELCLLQEK